jgi:hypothetical protein
MAEVQWEGQVVGLNFIVCGPSQVGKSTILGALRAPLRAFDDGENALRCTPLELTGSDVTLGVVPKFVEVHSEMTVEEQATPLLATTDGVLFISDSRRERLRDDVVAWAWLLEHLRAAKRDDVPIVVCYHRRDAANAMPTSDLDGALGVGRHPFFETDRDNPGGMLAAVIEVIRRASARAQSAVEALWPGWQRGPFLSGIDVRLSECNARLASPATAPAPAASPAPAAAPAPVKRTAAPAGPPEVPFRPEDTMVHPEAAHRVRRARRAPLLRFTTHCFGEADRIGRERRRLLEQLKCVVEESRRPMAFLKTLFDHLDRERKRLPVPLQEGIAGGEEILVHLERVLVTARRGVEAIGAERPRERAVDVGEGLHSAYAALRRDATVPRARLRVGRLPVVRGDAQGLGALLWAALAAVVCATRRRDRGIATVRVSARQRARGLRLRFASFESARRGCGIDELLLARRLAQRLGIGFSIVSGRRGGKAIALDLPPEMQVVEPAGERLRTREPTPLS